MDKRFFRGITGNGPVKEIKTMGELVSFVTLGPIRGEVKQNRGQKTQVTILGLEAKTDEGFDLETTRQKALRFIQQVTGHRDLLNAEQCLRQWKTIAFSDGNLLKTQNLKIVRKEGEG